VKGFAATPIIFIAVFLITVMLFLHFMDIDKQVAEGVGKEARLRKLQADMLKNQTAGETELYSCMSFYAKYFSNSSVLKDKIGECAGHAVTLINNSQGLTAYYDIQYVSDTLIDASLNSTMTVSEHMPYK
jgi:hypothetical protein